MNNFKSGDEGLVTYKSSNPFEFFHILNYKESEEQDMFGTFIFTDSTDTISDQKRMSIT